MTSCRHQSELQPISPLAYALALGAAGLAMGLLILASPRPAGALPAYAQQTHLACGRCHVNPAGGGERTAFGKAFAANGHKLPAAKGSQKSGGESGKSATSTPAEAPAIPAGTSFSVDQALSLRPPYYSLFPYDSCDYADCSSAEKK